MIGLAGVPAGMNALAAQIDLRGPHRRTALRARIATVIETLTGQPAESMSTRNLLSRLEAALHHHRPDEMWLAVAVISGRLPYQDAVLRSIRVARLEGPLAGLAETIAAPASPPMSPGRAWPAVRVLREHVIVDLHHTANTDFATGIQRVARETASRWYRDHDVTVVGWTERFTALRVLTPSERARALGHAPIKPADGPRSADVVVPWRSAYLWPELTAEPPRSLRMRSLLRFSGNEGGTIGFDLVPITSSETIAEGMGQGFSTSLAASAYARRVTTISEAAAVEYRGWREMLAGAGLPGPEIVPISLATEPVEPSEESIQAARKQLRVGDAPMVLTVGSHEPRKNHLAVLHAAEVLWREGLNFSLVFVGGNAWRDERFVAQTTRMQEDGRPIVSIRALPDDLLWAAYRLAHCLLFPSLNEGYGLPIAEALASGTPVVTSQFGSMVEITQRGGALLVNPRDDHDIAAGLRQMLTDADLYARLQQEARNFPIRTWDEYAAQTWATLMEDTSVICVEPIQQ